MALVTPTQFLLVFLFHVSFAKPSSHRNPPDIWLSRYREIDAFRGAPPDERFRTQRRFQNDFISKTGNDYVLSGQTQSAVFTCEADYPIPWKLPSSKELLEQFLPSRSIRSSYLPVDTSEPLNNRFRSSVPLFFSSDKFFSANLTCSSADVEQNGLESSVYIFLNGSSRIENEGKTLQVTFKSAPPPLVLPCRSSAPEIQIFLEKEWSTAKRTKRKKVVSKFWQPVSLSKSELSYDPKVGFTLQNGVYGNRILGLYRCSVVDGPHNDTITNGEFVLVNVTQEDTGKGATGNEDLQDFEPHSILHGKASVNVDSLEELRVTCCSGVKDAPPLLLSYPCQNPQECQLLISLAYKETFEHKEEKRVKNEIRRQFDPQNLVPSDCAIYPMFGVVSEILVCIGKNVDYLEQLVTVFEPQASDIHNRSGILTDGNLQNDSDQKFWTHYVPVAVAQKVTTAEKMMILVGRQIRKPRRTSQPVVFWPRLNDFVYDYDNSEDMDTNELLEKRRRSTIYLREYDRTVYYEGEPLLFMCFGVTYFYTREPHLRLNLQNGTTSILDPISDKPNADFKRKNTRTRLLYLSRPKMMPYRAADNFVTKFGPTVIARQEMKSVDCWMPKSDSAQWDKISRNLQILPSVAPKFAEKEEETLYFYLGDVGHVVTCTLVEGLPIPHLAVMQDGEQLKLKLGNYTKDKDPPRGRNLTDEATETEKVDKKKHLLTINIGFPVISHEHQTVLQCVAENVNGTATRTITVFVINRPGKVLPILLTITGILMALFVGLGMQHWYFKRRAIPPR